MEAEITLSIYCNLFDDENDVSFISVEAGTIKVITDTYLVMKMTRGLLE